MKGTLYIQRDDKGRKIVEPKPIECEISLGKDGQALAGIGKDMVADLLVRARVDFISANGLFISGFVMGHYRGAPTVRYQECGLYRSQRKGKKMKRSIIVFTYISLVVFSVILVVCLLRGTEVAKEPSIDVQWWYNFKTHQYVPWAGLPTNLHEYIPQDPPAQNMYFLLVDDVGVSPPDAMLQVLNAY